jgi:hypothetical protein
MRSTTTVLCICLLRTARRDVQQKASRVEDLSSDLVSWGSYRGHESIPAFTTPARESGDERCSHSPCHFRAITRETSASFQMCSQISFSSGVSPHGREGKSSVEKVAETLRSLTKDMWIGGKRVVHS